MARALGDLILMGFDEQQILNLAWALQSNCSNKESLEADLNKAVKSPWQPQEAN